jgi:hypothetical protein
MDRRMATASTAWCRPLTKAAIIAKMRERFVQNNTKPRESRGAIGSLQTGQIGSGEYKPARLDAHNILRYRPARALKYSSRRPSG